MRWIAHAVSFVLLLVGLPPEHGQECEAYIWLRLTLYTSETLQECTGLSKQHLSWLLSKTSSMVPSLSSKGSTFVRFITSSLRLDRLNQDQAKRLKFIQASPLPRACLLSTFDEVEALITCILKLAHLLVKK